MSPDSQKYGWLSWWEKRKVPDIDSFRSIDCSSRKTPDSSRGRSNSRDHISLTLQSACPTTRLCLTSPSTSLRTRTTRRGPRRVTLGSIRPWRGEIMYHTKLVPGWCPWWLMEFCERESLDSILDSQLEFTDIKVECNGNHVITPSFVVANYVQNCVQDFTMVAQYKKLIT